ncbi:hypothetical protein YC2023_048183 [Brassica napus]
MLLPEEEKSCPNRSKLIIMSRKIVGKLNGDKLIFHKHLIYQLCIYKRTDVKPGEI